MSNANYEKFQGNKWIKQGLIFGVIMYILNELIFAKFLFNETLSSERLLRGIIVWLIGGLLYGIGSKYLLKYLNGKK